MGIIKSVTINDPDESPEVAKVEDKCGASPLAKEGKRWCHWMDNLEQQNGTRWVKDEKWEHAGSWLFSCNVWRVDQNGPAWAWLVKCG